MSGVAPGDENDVQAWVEKCADVMGSVDCGNEELGELVLGEEDVKQLQCQIAVMKPPPADENVEGAALRRHSPLRDISPVRQASPLRQISPVRQSSPLRQVSPLRQPERQPSPVRAPPQTLARPAQARSPSPKVPLHGIAASWRAELALERTAARVGRSCFAPSRRPGPITGLSSDTYSMLNSAAAAAAAAAAIATAAAEVAASHGAGHQVSAHSSGAATTPVPPRSAPLGKVGLSSTDLGRSSTRQLPSLAELAEEIVDMSGIHNPSQRDVALLQATPPARPKHTSPAEHRVHSADWRASRLPIGSRPKDLPSSLRRPIVTPSSTPSTRCTPSPCSSLSILAEAPRSFRKSRSVSPPPCREESASAALAELRQQQQGMSVWSGFGRDSMQHGAGFGRAPRQCMSPLRNSGPGPSEYKSRSSLATEGPKFPVERRKPDWLYSRGASSPGPAKHTSRPSKTTGFAASRAPRMGCTTSMTRLIETGQMERTPGPYSYSPNYHCSSTFR